MFIPTFQGLTPNDFVRAAGSGRSRFPFDVPHLSFYRARNAIYYLFRALKSTNETLTVLVPDYNSGNEVLALEAAGATVHYYAVGPDGQADPDSGAAFGGLGLVVRHLFTHGVRRFRARRFRR